MPSQSIKADHPQHWNNYFRSDSNVKYNEQVKTNIIPTVIFTSLKTSFSLPSNFASLDPNIATHPIEFGKVIVSDAFAILSNGKISRTKVTSCPLELTLSIIFEKQLCGKDWWTSKGQWKKFFCLTLTSMLSIANCFVREPWKYMDQTNDSQERLTSKTCQVSLTIPWLIHSPRGHLQFHSWLLRNHPSWIGEFVCQYPVLRNMVELVSSS